LRVSVRGLEIRHGNPWPFLAHIQFNFDSVLGGCAQKAAQQDKSNEAELSCSNRFFFNHEFAYFGG
jgi:hypothetical protein